MGTRALRALPLPHARLRVARSRLHGHPPPGGYEGRPAHLQGGGRTSNTDCDGSFPR
ncbi:Hypothetical protein CAP_6805 [Chondromyces apiculatus DSM 436]|uniref:Uncharacterized protein n=1 Tax=Chondromyces apiculatus DSM 436 TaxID=1192034 RepID=A0A017TEQ8_9BACT|nr:Hypothetical protein CAP_6805 [Chondromyces apiculatus DSM 436]